MADLAAYERLRQVYGIRNRFWVRTPERMRPLLEEAHRRAIVRNQMALYTAILGCVRYLCREDSESITGDPTSAKPAEQRNELEAVFFARIARAWRRSGRLGDVTLQPGQTPVVLRHKRYQDQVTLIIRNGDGSLNTGTRRAVEPILEQALAILREESPENFSVNPREYATQVLIRCLPSQSAETAQTGDTHRPNEQIEAWNDLLRSAPGRMLGAFIPGLPLLLRLFTMRSREGWRAEMGPILREGAKESVQSLVRLLIRQLKSGGSLGGPISAVVGVGLDRIDTLLRTARQVEKARAALAPLHAYYNTHKTVEAPDHLPDQELRTL